MTDIDRLIGGTGADVLGGGAGSDLADYLFHTVAVTASIGDGPDGADGGSEGDDIQATSSASVAAAPTTR